jgi:decaprenylphospho-beta-D-erythro-pentofuranosid-2-ulose 2-reductase
MKDAFGHPQSVLVLGGTSDISRELVALLMADRGRSVVLAGRDSPALAKTAEDIGRSVAHVHTVPFDARTLESAEKTVLRCFEAAGEPIDTVIVAVGELGTQAVDEVHPDRVAQMLSVNFAWPAAALSAAANQMRRQGHGTIIVLTSVAGYRVRRSNFIYGSAKAGLDGFAVGLSESLRGTNVAVHIVRPGFVHTKMTKGRPVAPFATQPGRVASDIVKGIDRRQTVIWSPSVLGLLFPLLRLLPQGLWRRLPD